MTTTQRATDLNEITGEIETHVVFLCAHCDEASERRNAMTPTCPECGLDICPCCSGDCCPRANQPQNPTNQKKQFSELLKSDFEREIEESFDRE